MSSNVLSDSEVGVLWAVFGIGIGLVAGVALVKWSHKPWVHQLVLWSGLGAIVLAFAYVGYAMATRTPPDIVTVENVEHHVRDWVDSFGMTVKQANAAQTRWAILVTDQNRDSVVVMQPKENEKVLLLREYLNLPQPYQAVILRLTGTQRTEVKEQVEEKMSGNTPSGMEWHLAIGEPDPQQSVTYHIEVEPHLTKIQFMDAMAATKKARRLAVDSLQQAIRQRVQPQS